jgi:hypothetical protein
MLECIIEDNLHPPIHHFFTHVAQVPKQIFKAFIRVGKMVTPIGIDIEMLQYVYNMVWPWVSSVNVNEEVLVFNKDYVHRIDLFPIIEPSLMHHIITQLTNLLQGSINEPNATWEVLDPPHQDNPFFDNQP